MKNEYKRNCPNCKKELIYADKYKLNTAEKNKSGCYSCAKTGKSYCKGNKLSEEHKKRISESLEGRIVWKNPPMSGRTHSGETKLKMRKSKMDLISKNYFNGGQITPNFNPDACKIIEEYGKKNGYNFQHAMNGGEFYIKELGYWVDGIDHDKETIFEYYEKAHKKKIKKDKQRIYEIKKKTKYTIIIAREWTKDVEVVK